MRSYAAIKYISRFYIQYNDKWSPAVFSHLTLVMVKRQKTKKRIFLSFFLINPFVVYYSFFGFGVGYCVYTSAGICGFVVWLYKGRVRSSDGRFEGVLDAYSGPAVSSLGYNNRVMAAVIKQIKTETPYASSTFLIILQKSYA